MENKEIMTLGACQVSELLDVDLYWMCIWAGIEAKKKDSRENYIKALIKHGVISIQDEKEPVKPQEHDPVNNPSHYMQGTFETIDEMIILFGISKTITFCQLNAWKYRSRAQYKGSQEEDLQKANRYLEMAYKLQAMQQESENRPFLLLKHNEKEKETQNGNP